MSTNSMFKDPCGCPEELRLLSLDKLFYMDFLVVGLMGQVKNKEFSLGWLRI